MDRPDFLGESDTLSHGMCGEVTQKSFWICNRRKVLLQVCNRKKSLTLSYLHGPWARAMVICACAMMM